MSHDLGADKGFGRELALSIVTSSEQYRLILGCADLMVAVKRSVTVNSHVHADRAFPVRIDMADPDTLNAAVKLVKRIYGAVDVLIHNTGIGPRTNLFGVQVLSFMDVSVCGAISVTEAFLPLMKRCIAPRVLFIAPTNSIGIQGIAPNPAKNLYPLTSDYESSISTLRTLMFLYGPQLGRLGYRVHGVIPGLKATDEKRSDDLRKFEVDSVLGATRIFSVMCGYRDPISGMMIGPEAADDIVAW